MNLFELPLVNNFLRSVLVRTSAYVNVRSNSEAINESPAANTWVAKPSLAPVLAR